jgi:hypothetical protein
MNIFTGEGHGLQWADGAGQKEPEAMDGSAQSDQRVAPSFSGRAVGRRPCGEGAGADDEMSWLETARFSAGIQTPQIIAWQH